MGLGELILLLVIAGIVLAVLRFIPDPTMAGIARVIVIGVIVLVVLVFLFGVLGVDTGRIRLRA